MVKPLIDMTTVDIKWSRHKTSPRYFFSTVNNDLLLLRMNDFPDEPLLTLIRGTDILDIEDVPEKWDVPF